MISVQHISKSFGTKNKIQVLKNVSVKFPDKGLVVLLGHSGSGKTTFLNVIGGLDKASDGQILMDEIIVKNRSTQAWDQLRSRDIGYIFQNYHLIPTLSVFDNVAISLRIQGLKDELEIERRVLYILKAVKMHYFRGRLVSNLSGGQQQRVAIARAIVKNPKVILADEPTGNLDSKNTFEVMNIIKKIAEDRLVILVSHEKELVNHYADRIIEIKDGEIIHDFENTKSDHFAIDDNTLYLSDFEKDGSIKDVHWSIDAYREPESDEKKHYKVKLIVRNETLYLDFGNAIKNVRIVNNENNINIIEGSKSTEDKQQVDDTAFNMGELSDVSGHEKNPFLSLKKAFKDAFLGLFNVTKKTKMMLFVFFLMGVILAAGIPFINNVMSNRMLFTSDQEKYVSMTGILTSNANFKTIQSFKEADDDLFYINVFRPTPIVFNTLTIEGTQNIFLNANVGVIDHLDPSDIVYGKLPENQYEMVIDFSLILEDYSRYRSTLKRLGVWDFESVIGQKVVNQYLPEKPFVITGIVNTGAKRVYVARESVVFLAGNNDKNILTSDMFINDEDFVLTGLMPKSYDTMINRYEVLVPASYVSIYPNLYDYDFENGETLEIDFRVHVSGYYTYEGERNFNENTLLMPTLDLSLRLYQYTVSNMSISIYSQNPSSIILNAEDTFGNAIMTWPYQAARDEGRVFLLGLRTMMVLGIFLIVLSIASIYFLMKSSLSSRIYEISINRALGVKNKEIVKKFFVETFVLLTVSATFSYILVTILINLIDTMLIGESYYFLVTTWSVITGFALIYGMGLIGMVPVFLLLRKTPAQLLSYSDI